jgi:hypothetical protein
VSLLWLLRRYIDPIEHRAEAEDRRRARETAPADGQPDATDFAIPHGDADVGRYVCRICGHESGDGAYCPDCLADTMLPAAPGR